MNADEPFVTMLAGGHPNSLGQTVEVVEIVLADPTQLEQLYQCYFDDDEVVRLRVSNAMKRIWREKPDLLVPYIDRFLTEITSIQQASTQWTLAQLFLELQDRLSDEQREEAIVLMQRNLETWDDWIVLNNTMQMLGEWAFDRPDLKGWLRPHLERLAQDKRKSVAKKAGGFLENYTDLIKCRPRCNPRLRSQISLMACDG